MDDAIDNIESLDDTNLHPATIFRRKIYFARMNLEDLFIDMRH